MVAAYDARGVDKAAQARVRVPAVQVRQGRRVYLSLGGEEPLAVRGGPMRSSPRQGAWSDIERRADGGDVGRRRHAATRSEEHASCKAAPLQRACAELEASNDAREAYAPRIEGLDMSARLAELRTLGMPALRGKWRRLFRRDAPRLSRDQMIRSIAFTAFRKPRSAACRTQSNGN